MYHNLRLGCARTSLRSKPALRVGLSFESRSKPKFKEVLDGKIPVRIEIRIGSVESAITAAANIAAIGSFLIAMV